MIKNYNLTGCFINDETVLIIPSFKGEVTTEDSIEINSKTYQKIRGNLKWDSKYFCETFRDQKVVGLLGKKPDNIILIGFTKSDAHEPVIYMFPESRNEPSKHPWGNFPTVKLPENSTENIFFPGKLSPESYFFEKSELEKLKEEFTVNGGKNQFEVILKKIENIKKEYKKNPDSNKDIRTDLDMYLYW